MNVLSRTPAVSVVVPVHDARDYLRPCLDSVLAQSLGDIECICVDDGSTDDSLAILKEYEARDARVRVFHQENATAGAARNRGLEEARGDYVSFLDADDVFAPDMLETARRRCMADDLDFAVFLSDQLVSRTGRLRGPVRGFRRSSIPPYGPFTFRELTENVFRTFVGWAWDKLYKRSFVLASGLRFQAQRTTNDLFFVHSALLAARRIGVVDRVLAHQRVGHGGTLSRTRERSWRCFHDALAALRERIVSQGLWNELERDFSNYALHFSLWNLDTVGTNVRPALEKELVGGWFREFGVEGRPADFFSNPLEYARYRRLVRANKRRSADG
ncbi:MAG: glycosyltransferase [Kiritimatiellae bacterium]|nr:glycosyltransferase [Kiritimatiellia bacterium]